MLYRHSEVDTVIKNQLLYANDGSYFASKNYHEIDSIQMRNALADQEIIIEHLRGKVPVEEVKSFKEL